MNNDGSSNVNANIGSAAPRIAKSFGWIGWPLLVVATVLAVASGLSAEAFFEALLRTLGILTLVAIASATAGGTLGFLFGIPRTPSAGPQLSENVEYKAGVSGTANTNLEEVSNWLSKLLLGAGLTQLTLLFDFFVRISKFAGRGISSDIEFGATVVGGFAVATLTSGFVGGYSLTRTYLARHFLLADRVNDETMLGVRELMRTTSVDFLEKATGPNDLVPFDTRAAAQLREIPVEKLETEEMFLAAARANLMKSEPDMERATSILKAGLRKYKQSYSLRREYAWALKQARRYKDAMLQLQGVMAEAATSDLSDRRRKKVLGDQALFYLYLDRPERALEIIDRFSEEEKDQRYMLWVWEACALGPIYEKLADKATQEGERTALRALNACRRAVQKEPSIGKLLYALWLPEKGSDQDLVPFRRHPEFVAFFENSLLTGNRG